MMGNMNWPKETIITKTAIGITLVGSMLFAWELFGLLVTHINSGAIWRAVEHGAFIAFVSFIIYSGLVYQFTRLGHFKRQLIHRRASQNELDAFAIDRIAPPAVFLIPSYKEEERVIRQALLSVALQEYPNRRIVLLIDDPPNPISPNDQASLAATRRLTMEVQQVLDCEANKYREAMIAYINRKSIGDVGDLLRERETVVQLYTQAAQWFRNAASRYEVTDHTDRLFVEKILLERSYRYLEIAKNIRNSSSHLSMDRLEREYKRLSSLFQVELAYFERKRYVNLSHEPNKAMNLNSYIELMGRSFRETNHADGVHLEPTPPSDEMLNIPDADYIITLDADSLLLPEYALRLIHILEQPQNVRIAVIQTPYSAVPNPASIVERIAGATTDIQCVIHQGFTHFDATYWVGANAVLRKVALADIRVMGSERGFPIAKYIQDRTVIEDTESSVDLIARGWKLYNYPERLSYSASPPDFGSLLIQRRRWANGGIIILPKLFRYLLSRPFKQSKVGEGIIRFHYLASLAAVNFGLLLMLVYPFESSMRSFLLPVVCLPYFYLYGRDMVIIGYRASDLARVYALNLMLLPVNLAGVLKSLQQAICRRKVPFGRTPKVRGRTGVPLLYLVVLYGLLVLALSSFLMDMLHARYAHATFCLINSAFFTYIVVRFIGLRSTVEDIMSSNFLRSIERKWATLLAQAASATVNRLRARHAES